MQHVSFLPAEAAETGVQEDLLHGQCEIFKIQSILSFFGHKWNDPLVCHFYFMKFRELSESLFIIMMPFPVEAMEEVAEDVQALNLGQ